MASEVEISNAALQKLGQARITSLTEDSQRARECNSCYERLRDAEMQLHPWSFAVARASLAASSTVPTFNKTKIFPLPSDCLRLIATDPEINSLALDQDMAIEGRNIVCTQDAPLNIRYIRQVTDPNEMTALFREALACRMAAEMAEVLTQSSQKRDQAEAAYEVAIKQAKKVNAIERSAQTPPEDDWVTIRQ